VGGEKPPTFFHEHDGGKKVGKETIVPIYDSIHKNKF